MGEDHVLGRFEDCFTWFLRVSADELVQVLRRVGAGGPFLWRGQSESTLSLSICMLGADTAIRSGIQSNPWVLVTPRRAVSGSPRHAVFAVSSLQSSGAGDKSGPEPPATQGPSWQAPPKIPP